jgi:hypothetical protein
MNGQEEEVSTNHSSVRCPGCERTITPNNAGGYRTFCRECVSAFPPFPNDGNGHLIADGCRYPNFRWD